MVSVDAIASEKGLGDVNKHIVGRDAECRLSRLRRSEYKDANLVFRAQQQKTTKEASYTSVLVNREKCEKFRVLQGVLQGDCLSTTLFILHMNALLESLGALGCGVTILDDGRVSFMITDLAYADDITIAVTRKESMQRVIDTLCRWAHKWQMSVITTKTHVVAVNHRESEHVFRFGDAWIEIVDNAECFGVIFNSALTWDDQDVCALVWAQRAQRAKLHLSTRKFLDIEMQVQYWAAETLPALVYCVGAWTLSQNSIREVQGVAEECTGCCHMVPKMNAPCSAAP